MPCQYLLVNHFVMEIQHDQVAMQLKLKPNCLVLVLDFNLPHILLSVNITI